MCVYVYLCVYIYTHTCMSWHEVYLLSPSAEVIHDYSVLWSSSRKFATVPVGKEAGVLLVLQTVQLKTRPEPSVSLMWLSDSKNFLATAFFLCQIIPLFSLVSFLKWTGFYLHDKSPAELGGKMPSAHSYGVYFIVCFLIFPSEMGFGSYCHLLF